MSVLKKISTSRSPAPKGLGSLTQRSSVRSKQNVAAIMKEIPKSDPVLKQDIIFNVYAANCHSGKSFNQDPGHQKSFVSCLDILTKTEVATQSGNISPLGKNHFHPYQEACRGSPINPPSKKNLNKLGTSNTRQTYSKMFQKAVIEKTGRPSYRKQSKSPNRQKQSKKDETKRQILIPKEKEPTNLRSETFLPRHLHMKTNSMGRRQNQSLEDIVEEFQNKLISSKGSMSSFGQEIAAKKLSRARSSAYMDAEGFRKEIKRTSIIEEAGRAEEELNNLETMVSKKPQLRKIHSSYDFGTHSAHALILGKYGKPGR